MRILTNAAVLGCLWAVTLGAANPIIGTWKVNSAKTKSSLGPPPKALTAVYRQEGDWIVAKMTGVDGWPDVRQHTPLQTGRKRLPISMGVARSSGYALREEDR